MAKILKWSVADIDDGILGTFHTKREALQFCRDKCLDDRKYAGWRRIYPGLYEYNSPRSFSTDRIDTYCVGTREALIKEAFDECLEAFEQDHPLEPRDQSWNHLAAPTMRE
jgi:hypothetical protein